MARIRNIEDVFLEVLGQNRNKGTIKKKIRDFKKDDWEELVELAIRNYLVAALYRRLSLLQLEEIPTNILYRLKTLFLLNLKRNTILEKEALRLISSCFKKGNIAAVPLKGPLLGRYLYDDLAVRQVASDLDFLVPREKLKEATEALERNGCLPSFDKNNTSVLKFYLTYYRQLVFKKEIKKGLSLKIELHFDLGDEFTYAPLDDFWPSLTEVTLGTNNVWMPSKENLLIYLSLQAISINEFIELRYLYDIHSLASKFKNELNWGEIASKIRDDRYKGFMFFALTLSQKCFHTEIPSDFLRKIKPDIFKIFFLKTLINRKNILCKRNDSSYSWYYFFTLWHYFATSYLYSRDVIDCLRISYRKIFLPLDMLAVCYSKPQIKVTYFFYLKRLLKPLTNLLYKNI